MQDIQTIALTTFQENLSYLCQEHPVLYNKILALNTLLEEGKYPQKYDLEYKEDYFDVKELSSGNYLYNENSIQHAKKLTKNITLLKNDHTIATFQNLQFDLPKMTFDDLKNINPLRRYASLAPIVDYYTQNVPKNSSFIRIYKYMFFGVGLGLHLPAIVKKTNADVYLIIEDDIELFRLSLFTCNYKKNFANKTIHFSIAQNKEEFSQTFQNFYTQALLENHYLKFSVLTAKDQYYIKKIQTEITIRPEKVYEHHALLVKNLRIMRRITQGYKFLSMLPKEHQFFEDKPILILGAGPSLGHNQEWLQQNHNKFIIIAPFMTLRLLYKLNIIPDIIIHIDEGDQVANKEVEFHKEHLDFFNNSLFIFAASISDIFFNTFEKEYIYLLEERTSYKQNNNQIQVGSVGEAAYAVGLSLTKHSIYLLGLDLALSETGDTHIQEHTSFKNNKDTLSVQNVDIIEKNATLRKSTLMVPGNFQKEVPTIPLFEMSIRAMNFQTQIYKNPQRSIFNLSDGARFENIKPTPVETINLSPIKLSKVEIFNSLKEIFDKYSSKELTKDETLALYEREKRVQEYHRINEEFYHSSTTNEGMFIQSLANLTTKFLRMKADELNQIFVIYILELFTYPVDMLSTKEVTNKKKHSKKLKKMLFILIKNIIKTYEKDLENLLKNIEVKN